MDCLPSLLLWSRVLVEARKEIVRVWKGLWLCGSRSYRRVCSEWASWTSVSIYLHSVVQLFLLSGTSSTSHFALRISHSHGHFLLQFFYCLSRPLVVSSSGMTLVGREMSSKWTTSSSSISERSTSILLSLLTSLPLLNIPLFERVCIFSYSVLYFAAPNTATH